MQSSGRLSALPPVASVVLAVALSGCDAGGGGGGGAVPVDGHTLGTLGDAHTTSRGVDAIATDTAHVSASCIQGADLDAIQLHILATSGVCGLLCAHAAAPSDCAATCVESRNSHIGPTCSRCFGDLALCAAAHCLSACATAPSDACVSCGQANCAAEFERCYDAASLIPTGCDGPAYCPPADTTAPETDAESDDTAASDADDGSHDPDVTPDSGPEDACPAAPIYYRDGDGDGFGEAAWPREAWVPFGPGCTAPEGYTDVVGDCDDGEPLRSPGASEACDLVDNDCDGRTDDGCWAELGVGAYHTCAIRKADGAVVCWGSDFHGEATEPSGSFIAVAAGRSHNCAARSSGGITCWGADARNDDSPAVGIYPQVTASTASYTCGVREDHVARCWGYGEPVAGLPMVAFVSLSAGEWHACGVDTDGWVMCWGFGGNFELAAPSGTFTKVSSGFAKSCALRDDHAIRCWGNGIGDPAGTYLDVAVGREGACAIRTDGTLYCWGPGSGVFGDPPGDAGWGRVGVGDAHACALGVDGAIACWGDDQFGQLGPL